ncbi:MAG TPA: autotransporter outer membrane beta-barrel domain-containing protein [Candidatus Megaira endosymbiont of Stentor roeselii]|nr:autotransporter outer membrane beta-barrel domain-containing protein [Candidatus Megaera endosymbiont of Stentor roeselii]
MKKFKLSTSFVSILAISALSGPILSIQEASAMFGTAQFKAIVEARAAARAAAAAGVPPPPPPGGLLLPPPPPGGPNEGKPGMGGVLAELAKFKKGKLRKVNAQVPDNPVKPTGTPSLKGAVKNSGNHDLSGYSQELELIKRLQALANKAVVETPVVDPVQREKLAQEKVTLENRARDIETQITEKRKVIKEAVDQVANIALAKRKSDSSIETYKSLMLKKGIDFSRAESVSVGEISGVQGALPWQRKAEKAWTEITTSLELEKQGIREQLSEIGGQLNGMRMTENATDTDKQVQKIERVIEDVLGVGAKQDDIRALVNGFSQLIRKGENTEALCLTIRAYKNKIDSYASKVERQMKGLNFNNSEGEKTSIPQIKGDRVDNYSMSVVRSYDESASAVIITDDKTGKRIIADSESISHFITPSGEWNKKFIKQKFDKEYIQEAQMEVTAHPEKHEEVFEKLVSRKVELDDIDLNNDYTRVAGLKDEDKALIYLLLTPKFDAEFEKQRIKEMSMVSSAISSDIVRTAFNTIDSRLASLAGIGASSDESEKKAFALHGVWVSGTYAKARQKEYGEVSGYKGKSGGGTVGVDFSVNDEGTIIGTSYSRIVSNITANQPVNSKIKAVSNILSVYTKINFGNKFDLSTVLAGNNTRFTHKYQKMIGRGNYQTAKSKFTSNGFNAQMLLNYNITLGDNFMVMPRVGIQYGTQTNSAYTESGAGVHNLSIAAKNSKGFSGTAGLKLSKEFLVGNTHIIPSLLAAVQKDFSRSKDKIQARYVWASGSSTETHTFNRGKSLGYNLGAGLGVNHKNVEVLAEYNCHLKKKYVGHQGTLKLKLLF